MVKRMVISLVLIFVVSFALSLVFRNSWASEAAVATFFIQSLVVPVVVVAVVNRLFRDEVEYVVYRSNQADVAGNNLMAMLSGALPMAMAVLGWGWAVFIFC